MPAGRASISDTCMLSGTHNRCPPRCTCRACEMIQRSSPCNPAEDPLTCGHGCHHSAGSNEGQRRVNEAAGRIACRQHHCRRQCPAGQAAGGAARGRRPKARHLAARGVVANGQRLACSAGVGKAWKREGGLGSRTCSTRQNRSCRPELPRMKERASKRTRLGAMRCGAEQAALREEGALRSAHHCDAVPHFGWHIGSRRA